MLTDYAGRRCARALNARRHRRDMDRLSGPRRRASGLKQRNLQAVMHTTGSHRSDEALGTVRRQTHPGRSSRAAKSITESGFEQAL